MTEPSRILIGDTIEQMGTLPEKCVQCCVTSPPYWGLRDYGVDGQIGLESTPDEFVQKMVEVGRAVHRVLRDDGTFWLNIGDSYANDAKWGGTSGAKNYTSAAGGYSRSKKTTGMKPKDLCMMPWRVAMALQADGWWIRSVIVWAKKSPMPESCTDRPTSSWEPIFLLTKSERYFYDAEAVKEPLNDDTISKIKKCMVSPPNEARYKQNDAIAHIGGGSTVSPNAAWRDAEKLERMLSGRNQRNVWHLGPEPFTGFVETVDWHPVEVGAVGDDIRRTPSADCPIHGCSDSRRDGERGECSTSRSLDTDGRPVPEQCDALPTIEEHHGRLTPACGSDSLAQPCSPTATSRNNRSHKTDPVPSTTPPCTPSDQTGGCTLDTSTSPEFSDSAGHTPASSIAAGCVEDASGSSPLEQTRTNIVGICTCKYHRRIAKKIDHFATFPTEIPRRAIKAGTSEKGCCPACRAPWNRVVARTSIGSVSGSTDDSKSTLRNDALKHGGRVGEVLTKTTGWTPSCECNAGEPVPCLVLDPFLGSGTTVAVARELGRHGVGCELNPEYANLAAQRIGKAERPETYRDDTKVTDAPLFTALGG